MAKPRKVATPRDAARVAKRNNLKARLAAVQKADRKRLLRRVADALAADAKAPRRHR